MAPSLKVATHRSWAHVGRIHQALLVTVCVKTERMMSSQMSDNGNKDDAVDRLVDALEDEAWNSTAYVTHPATLSTTKVNTSTTNRD